MKVRLSRMILHSVAVVSHLSLGVSLMFIYPLVLRAGQLNTDSVESLCVSFLLCGKEGRLWKRRYRWKLCQYDTGCTISSTPRYLSVPWTPLEGTYKGNYG